VYPDRQESHGDGAANAVNDTNNPMTATAKIFTEFIAKTP